MEENNKTQHPSREFDLIELAKKVLAEKKLLFRFIVVFTLIGVIYALNQQKRYTSVVTMAPEVSGMGMSGSLSDIAGMVGLNLDANNGGVDAIYPEIYPEVLASSSFLIKLFPIQVRQKNDTESKTYYNHLKYDTKSPFWTYPGYLLGEFIRKITSSSDTQERNDTIIPTYLTKEQDAICGMIRRSIDCQINKGTNVITISVEDIDPIVATTIADTVQKRLQDYITLYRTQKARIDQKYAEKLNKIAEKEYQKAQLAYASYADSHIKNVLTMYQTQLEALENNVEMKYKTFSQTAAQVEQAKAKVQERTPAFTVIQEPCVPLRASSTPRSMMVLGFIILGILVDSLWVLYLRDVAKSILFKKKK